MGNESHKNVKTFLNNGVSKSIHEKNYQTLKSFSLNGRYTVYTVLYKLKILY